MVEESFAWSAVLPAISKPKLTASSPLPTICAEKDVGVVAASMAVPFFVLLVVVYATPVPVVPVRSTRFDTY